MFVYGGRLRLDDVILRLEDKMPLLCKITCYYSTPITMFFKDEYLTEITSSLLALHKMEIVRSCHLYARY